MALRPELGKLVLVGTFSSTYALMGIEALVGRWRHAQVYRFADTVSNLGAALTQQVAGFVIGALFYGVYLWCYAHRVVTLLESNPTTWAIGFVGVDFLYYWYHRFAHRFHLLWASHSVHHQPRLYDLSVAQRQSILNRLVQWPVYLPLALLGVPPLVFAASDTLGTLYQFWLHTPFIKRLGWLEAVFSTPSRHRVHHGTEPEYVDKNFGAVFIVWDRMFGTASEEKKTPVYGLVPQFTSANPMWAQAEPVLRLVRWSRTAPTWASAASVWFRTTRWSPPWDVRENAPASEPTSSPAIHSLTITSYAGASFLVAQAAVFLLVSSTLTGIPRAVALELLGFVLFSLAGVGGLLDGRPWARKVELVRCGSQIVWAATIATLYATLRPFAWTVAAISLVFGLWALCWPRHARPLS